jgi:hypothetical protein
MGRKDTSTQNIRTPSKLTNSIKKFQKEDKTFEEPNKGKNRNPKWQSEPPAEWLKEIIPKPRHKYQRDRIINPMGLPLLW